MRAILAILIALVLMFTRSYELAAAFLLDANIALLFSVALEVPTVQAAPMLGGVRPNCC